MSTFLYFAANVLNPITPDVIDRLALRYAFDNVAASAAHGVITGRTPSNTAGTIFADSERLGSTDLAYRPDEQVWRPLPGKPACYVGYWQAHKPTAAHLLRAKVTDGEFVQLADGQEWLVPRVRMFGGEDGFRTALPTLIDVDDAGELIVGGLADEHAELDRLGQRLLEGMFGAELELAPRLSVKEAVETVAQLLAVNYVVSAVELGKRMLGVLANDDSLIAACRAAVDYATAVDWTEKKSAGVVAG